MRIERVTHVNKEREEETEVNEERDRLGNIA